MAGNAPPPQRIEPGPGQELVWDYPRPPRVERVPERIRVVVDGIEIASSASAQRVLETAGAPVYYVPPADVRRDLLVAGARTTACEWKGEARYWSIATPGGRVDPECRLVVPGAPAGLRGDRRPRRLLRLGGRRGMGRR